MEPLIVIVGQTASGKSALALELAERYDGEIIAADSRTVYTGMDIGTAKPSQADQSRVLHHLINVVTPDQTYTVADFQRQAQAAITDIHNRGKLPIMVGGTGLYVDSVLYDFTLRPVDATQRAEFEKLSISELQKRIAEQGLQLPNDPQNPRHLVRVLESGGEPSRRKSLRANTLVLGLHVSSEILQQRITDRVEKMFKDGLKQEVGQLAVQYGWQAPGLSAIGYQEFQPYFAGDTNITELQKQITTHTQQYAKRQRVWFKRNSDIQWCDTKEQAEQLAEAFLTTKEAA